MKMPHADDHTIRSSQSPHRPHHQSDRMARNHQSYYYDKRSSEAELSPHVPRHEAHSPHQWRPPQGGDPHQQSPMDTASVNMTTPPASPHVPPRYDYSSYDSYHRGGPIPPYSQRGGYSYFHHHPNSRPPMMPREMHPYGPPPPHYPPPPRHPADNVMSPPPPYTGSYHPHSGMPPPRFETPPLTSGPSPVMTTSYYHDQQYPHFLPPSASMSTTASSRSGASASLTPREEEDYPYDAAPSSSFEEVNQVGPNDVLCGRGAPTNYHPGNEYFRDLVKQYQSTYLASKRADKPFVASHIVNIIQSRGGRFLRRYKRNGVSWERGHFVWVEVDPQKAYEKACQALREGAPEIRRKMQTENVPEENEDSGDGSQQTPGERMPDEQTDMKKESPKEEGDKNAETGPKESTGEDDRNDEMEDSERS